MYSENVQFIKCLVFGMKYMNLYQHLRLLNTLVKKLHFGPI